MNKEEDTIIIGDFNYSNISWEHITSDHNSDVGMIVLVKDCFLLKLVNAPTRYNVCLDLVLTNNEARMHSLKVIEPLGVSEHNMIQSGEHKSRVFHKSKAMVYNFRRAD